LMNKIKRIAFCLTICTLMALPTNRQRGMSSWNITVKGMNVPAGTTQNISVKNDRIMVKAVGGDKNLDLLYRHAGENVV
jgi:hypothetical protein